MRVLTHTHTHTHTQDSGVTLSWTKIPYVRATAIGAWSNAPEGATDFVVVSGVCV